MSVLVFLDQSPILKVRKHVPSLQAVNRCPVNPPNTGRPATTPSLSNRCPWKTKTFTSAVPTTASTPPPSKTSYYAFMVRAILFFWKINIPCNLSINRKNEQILFSEEIKAQIVAQSSNFPTGGTMRLDCHASGYPQPRVRWYLNAQEIVSDGDRSQVFSNGTLIVKKLRAADAGVYQCQANNEHTTASDSLRVFVTGNHSFPLQSILSEYIFYQSHAEKSSLLFLHIEFVQYRLTKDKLGGQYPVNQILKFNITYNLHITYTRQIHQFSSLFLQSLSWSNNWHESPTDLHYNCIEFFLTTNKLH